MKNLFLDHCLAFADDIERAALTLDAETGPLAGLSGRCAAFRAACQTVATNRGLQHLTIAFVGPRNAGKTTLLSALLPAPDLREQLPRGLRAADSTRRLYWLGPAPPAGLREDFERWIPVPGLRLGNADIPVELVDVPGFDDRDPERREIARRALASAWVKVLVVEERSLEAFAIREYLESGDGSIVLPVVNKAGRPAPAELAAFRDDLGSHLPDAEILAPLVVPDFEREGAVETEVLESASSDLTAAITSAVRARGPASDWAQALAQPQLQAKLRRFRAEVRQTAKAALPASTEAMTALAEAESGFSARLVDEMLGAEKSLLALFRARVRSLLWENTPLLCFPWRLLLGTANLIWGALDRLPLLFLGSLPAWLSTAWTAARNLQMRHAASAKTDPTSAPSFDPLATATLQPALRSFHASLRVDLGRPQTTGPMTNEGRDPVVRLRGTEALQREVAGLFAKALDAATPGPVLTLFAGWVGTAIFWLLFTWPLLAVYGRYGEAVAAVWAGQKGASALFPTGLGSLLGSSALLALFPMGAWLLMFVGTITRKRRLRRHLTDLRRATEAELARLVATGTLQIDLPDRELEACQTLLGADR